MRSTQKKNTVWEILKDPAFAPGYVIFIFAILVVGFYAKTFGYDLQLPISAKQEDWGQFGDYVGGILNPVCAFMAFLWIVRSYALQKTELAETRDTLKETHQAQLLQAKISYASARIETANIRISLLNAREEQCAAKIHDLHQKRHGASYSQSAISVSERSVMALTAEIVQIENLRNEQMKKIEAIESELSRSWVA